jgi:hypothetical protein
MKKLKLLVFVFLISLSIFLFASLQVVKTASSSTVSVPTLNPGSAITLGGSVTVNVIVGGIGGTPTGTITFQYSTDSGATWNALGSIQTLSKGSATSDSYTPNAVGSTYRIRALYSGDGNYNGATGAPASLTVSKATPTVPGPTLNTTSPISLGGSVTVAVTVSGVSGITPNGTVTFQYSADSGSTWTQLGTLKTLFSGSATSDSYTPNAVGSTYRIRALYSGDGNYNGATGAAASLTVNKANAGVPAPSVSLNPILVNNVVIVSVAISGVYGGATPIGTATFQVKIGNDTWTTIGSAVSLSNGMASTNYVPQTMDNYQFQVIYGGDSNYNGATGYALTVTSNFAPLDNFVFSSVATQAADASFNITITARDASNNTLTNYIGTNTLSVSTGTISPTITGVFSSGVWTGSVIITHAGSGISLFTTGSSMSGTSNLFTVNSGPLNIFTFGNIVNPQSVGSTFSITVLAKDVYGNTVTGYTGAPSLTYSAGSISPQIMNSFVNGVGSTLVTVDTSGSSVNIIATDGSHSGISNSFSVTIPSTSTTTQEPTPTITQTQTLTPLPTSRTTSAPKATPTSTSQVSLTATPTPSNSTFVSPNPSPSGINLNKTIEIDLPLSFLDISLFLAFLSIILLPTSKLLPRYYQMVTPLARKLEAAAVLVSILFLLTVAIQVVMAILNI